MPTKKAEAQWNGDLKNGKGVMKLGSGSYEGKYSFATRFEDNTGSNPEELIGAALAGCYSMALSKELAEAGYIPESVETNAEVAFGITDDGPAIKEILLHTDASVPDINEQDFIELTEAVRKGCPVSKALTGIKIEVNAQLAWTDPEQRVDGKACLLLRLFCWFSRKQLYGTGWGSKFCLKTISTGGIYCEPEPLNEAFGYKSDQGIIEEERAVEI